MEEFIFKRYELAFADIISCKQKISFNSKLKKTTSLGKSKSEINN